MDDPISALDANVRKKIFERVFQNMLKDKTRILVTHAIDFLHLADRIVVMKDGQIKTMGTYEEVLKNPIVEEIVSIHKKNQNDKKEAFDQPTTAEDSENSRNSRDSDLAMKTKKSSSMTNLTPQKIDEKLEKFSRG